MPSSDTEQQQGDSKRAKISTDEPAKATECATAKPASKDSPFYQTETDVGITEFITPGWKGFDAVIKHRFCDFLVNEIDQSGKVVHLTSFTDADDPAPPKDENDLEVPEDPKEAFEEAFTHLTEILGAEDTQKIRTLLEADEDAEKAFVLERELDKYTRTRIYGVTNGFLPTQVSVNTQDGHMVFKRLPPNAKPKSGRRRWVHVGDFCHFVMQKESRDSMDVLNQLAKLLRVKPTNFGMAGTKDKRGVTVQKCSTFKIEHSRLISASLRLQGARLGNFSYAASGLSLGDLAGNQFQITLRYVEGADPVSLQPVLDGITNTGFINYFGMQRFGNSSVPSHAVGIEVLKGNYQKAVDLILMPRQGDHPKVAKARAIWAKTKDADRTLAAMPPRIAMAERSILLHFVKTKNQRNCAGAFGTIPRNLRLMYLHAYQSFVWNSAVSKRIQLFGMQGPVPGDLVIKATSYEAGKTDAVTGERLRYNPVVVTSENMHEYSIDDVVLPLPGAAVIYPDNQVKGFYLDLMKKEELSPFTLGKHPSKEYRLAGAYRHIIIKPRDFAYEWMRYDDGDLPLLLTDVDKIMEKEQPTSVENGQHLALRLKFDLPSSAYATMLLRELMRQETASGYQSKMSEQKSEQAADQ